MALLLSQYHFNIPLLSTFFQETTISNVAVHLPSEQSTMIKSTFMSTFLAVHFIVSNFHSNYYTALHGIE